jgi:hypothetical protein
VLGAAAGTCAAAETAQVPANTTKLILLDLLLQEMSAGVPNAKKMSAGVPNAKKMSAAVPKAK